MFPNFVFEQITSKNTHYIITKPYRGHPKKVKCSTYSFQPLQKLKVETCSRRRLKLPLILIIIFYSFSCINTMLIALLVSLSSCLLKFLITVVLYNYKSVKFKTVSCLVPVLKLNLAYVRYYYDNHHNIITKKDIDLALRHHYGFV